MAKILKRVGADYFINDTGETVPSGGTLTIDPAKYDLYARSSDTIAALASGDLVLNDGSKDLELSDATLHLQGQFPSQPKTDVAKIPKVAIYEAEGDFNSVVSHNYSDNSTWPSVGDSTFVLEPEAGKRMFLKKAEVQFTHDIQLSGVSELFFDIWVYNPLFDVSQQPEVELDTYNPMTDAPRNQLRFLFERNAYRSILDVLNIGNAHYTMDAVDGITTKLSTVQFNYPRAIPLLSSQGGQVRCSSKDNIELGGTFCTITFTTSSEDE